MNVELPDGTVIEDVPEGMSQRDLVAKLKANGYDTSWYKQPVEVPESGVNRLLSNVIGGSVETVMSMGTGAVASAVGGLAGLLPGTLEERTQRIQGIQQAGTYQPRSAAGQAIVGGLGTAFEKVNELVGEGAAKVVPKEYEEEARSIGQVALPIVATAAPLVPIAKGTGFSKALRESATKKDTAKASAEIEQRQATAKQGEVAQYAQDLGIAINPGESNPTLANRTLAAMGGNVLKEDLVKVNTGVPERVVKRDVGLADDARLTLDSLKELRSNISAPINELKAIGRVDVPAASIDDLTALKLDDVISPAAKQVNKKIDKLASALTEETTASVLWNRVRALRKQAQTGFKSDDPKLVEAAEANLKIANVLEGVLDNHLQSVGNVKLLNEVRDARAKLAKTYAVERVLNNSTERVNVSELAKIVKKDNALTGDISKLAEVAANYPEAFAVTPVSLIDKTSTQLIRTGIPATVGGVMSEALGVPYYIGAPLGAGVGRIGEALTGRVLSGKASQAKRVVPEGLMSPVPGMMQATAQPPSTALTPYVQSGDFQPAGTGPNWTAGRRTVDPDVQPVMPQQPPALGYTPNAEMIRPRQWANRTQVMEQEAAAREAATPRQPASGGQLYDFDPITGRLRPADQGIKGATLSVVEKQHRDLASAMKKINEGRGFALTSEERIAYNNWRRMAESDMQGMLTGATQ